MPTTAWGRKNEGQWGREGEEKREWERERERERESDGLCNQAPRSLPTVLGFFCDCILLWYERSLTKTQEFIEHFFLCTVHAVEWVLFLSSFFLKLATPSPHSSLLWWRHPLLTCTHWCRWQWVDKKRTRNMSEWVRKRKEWSWIPILCCCWEHLLKSSLEVSTSHHLATDLSIHHFKWFNSL